MQKNTNNLDQIIYDIYSCVEHNKNNPDMKVYQKELIKLYHVLVGSRRNMWRSTRRGTTTTTPREWRR